MESRYLVYTAQPNVAIDGTIEEVRSSRGTYAKNSGRFIAAKSTQAKAFIPRVSENRSTKNPIKKLNVNNRFKLVLIGKRMMKNMKMKGIATLKSAI